MQAARRPGLPTDAGYEQEDGPQTPSLFDL